MSKAKSIFNFSIFSLAGASIGLVISILFINDDNESVDINGQPVANGQNVVKAIELSGKDFLLFMEDSQTGELICKPNTKVIQLNEALHKN